MGRPAELYIEHRRNGKVLGARRLRAKGHPWIVGASKHAHLRLIGGEACGIHASFEHIDGVWKISDLGSSNGTTVDGLAIVEEQIRGPVNVVVGDHELKVLPVYKERELFDRKVDGSIGAYQQVVVKSGGFVLETKILKANEQFEYNIGAQKITVPAATSAEWVSSEAGGLVVLRRLVDLPKPVEIKTIEINKDDAKAPALVTIGFFILLGLVGLIFSKSSDKPAENQVTKMIFDAKVIQQKKKQSQNVSEKKFAKAMSGGPAKAAQSNNQKPTVATKVISSIKASGLEKLVGRIASRAAVNANAIAVASAGKDEHKGGPAFASNSLVKGNNVGAEKGSGYRVGGVSTEGKGGGGTGYAQGAGMAAGNVAVGEVGAIDEESVVEGGLDPEVIAAVIRSQLGQIRYCYERQLSAQPDLYGKVQIKFVIGPDGLVGNQQISSSSLKSASVEGCILRRVAGWKFPLPKGGTSVYVTYPFLFKANN